MTTARQGAAARAFSDADPSRPDLPPVPRAKASITMFALIIIGAYLLPLLYMVDDRVPAAGPVDDARARRSGRRSPQTGIYQGEEYPIYTVPIDGVARELILIEPGRESSVFVDPTDPTPTPIEWVGPLADARAGVGVRAGDRRTSRRPGTSSTSRGCCATRSAIALLSTIGAVGSSILVAYGFARFRFPGRNALFVILLATIILPFQVTLIPQYVIFTWLGWNGTWLPLIVPHFFANAYNVFLLRQYFMTIPRDLDEAAMIDGAGPFRILRSIIVPQSIPAIIAVTPVPLLLRLERLLRAAAVPRRQARAPAAVDRHPAVQRAVRHASRRSSRRRPS